jgi:hypothetical protein
MYTECPPVSNLRCGHIQKETPPHVGGTGQGVKDHLFRGKQQVIYDV